MGTKFSSNRNKEIAFLLAYSLGIYLIDNDKS